MKEFKCKHKKEYQERIKGRKKPGAQTKAKKPKNCIKFIIFRSSYPITYPPNPISRPKKQHMVIGKGGRQEMKNIFSYCL
jgi:hypothetical protein